MHAGPVGWWEAEGWGRQREAGRGRGSQGGCPLGRSEGHGILPGALLRGLPGMRPVRGCVQYLCAGALVCCGVWRFSSASGNLARLATARLSRASNQLSVGAPASLAQASKWQTRIIEGKVGAGVGLSSVSELRWLLVRARPASRGRPPPRSIHPHRPGVAMAAPFRANPRQEACGSCRSRTARHSLHEHLILAVQPRH